MRVAAAFHAAGEAFGAVVEAVAGVVAVEAVAVALAREAGAGVRAREAGAGVRAREAVPGVRAWEEVQEALVREALNNAEALKEVEPEGVKTIAVGSERTPAAATAGASS